MDAASFKHLLNALPGSKQGLAVTGLTDYDAALAACGALGKEYAATGAMPACVYKTRECAASGAKYELDDFLSFLCWSQNHEAYDCKEVPKPAPPVSLGDDLGLDVPTPVRRLPIRRKTPASATTVSIVASVLPELLSWSCIVEATSVTRCCRAFHAGGLFTATRLVERRRIIADSVASQLSLHTPQAIALQKAGVSRSTLLRTLACAWDWLDRISDASLGSDEHLTSLALTRLSVKFEFTCEHTASALKLFGSVEQKPALSVLECRLMMSLPNLGETHVCAPACKSQPLARMLDLE